MTTVNRALVWHGPEDVRLEDRPLPERPRAGWVRIGVAWCGVCGSDVTELLRGPVVLPVEPHRRLGTSVPLVLGHEIAGEVVAVGDGVDGLRPGDRVVSDSLDGCGACAHCGVGDVNLCEGLAAAGLHFDGGLARWVDLPADSCRWIPEELPLDVAALAEPLAVAEHAVGRAGRLTGSVVVLGAGAVGTLVAFKLRDSGQHDVTLVDTHEGRRQQAAARTGFSAVDVVPPLAPGAVATVFECSGSAEALNAALRAVPVRTHVVLIGVHSEVTPTDLDAVLRKEVTLTGSLSHSRMDFERAVGRLVRSPETFRSLLGRRVGLDDAPAALTRLAHAHDDAGKLLVGGQEYS